MKTWNHDELAADLANHIIGMTDRVAWCDMQLGPSGSVRPDVYTITKSFVRPQFIAYECKISVSDFRADVTTGKWQSYLKYSQGVYFAAPQGLLKKEDIPATCGFYVRGEAGWKAVRKATLSTFDMPKSAWLKLLFDGLERPHRTTTTRRFHEWDAERKAAKKFGDAVGLAARDLARVEEIVGDAKRQAAVIIEQARKWKESGESQKLSDMESLKRSLCSALSLPATAEPPEIRSVIRQMTTRLDTDEEIGHLRRQLGIVRNALNSVDHPCAGTAFEGELAS